MNNGDKYICIDNNFEENYSKKNISINQIFDYIGHSANINKIKHLSKIQYFYIKDKNFTNNFITIYEYREKRLIKILND